MASNRKKLQDRHAAIVQEMGEIHGLSVEESRGLTEEETARFEALDAELKDVDAALDREQKILDAQRELIPDADDGTTVQDPNQPLANQQKWESFGEFLRAVHHAGVSRHPNEWDPRLTQPHGAATGMNEAVGSDGGFLVATDFVVDLMTRTYNSNAILGGTGYSTPTRIPISTNANSTKISKVAETSRVDGSRAGGIQAYWEGEADQITSSKPKLRQISLDLKKLTGMCYATEEMLQDAATLEAFIRAEFSKEFNFKIQDALINGTGAGQPLGILGAPCLVSVAKETGQAAATIVKENIDKMWARMWPQGIFGSVWLINQDCYPQLFSMSQAVGTGGVPVYLPPGGMSSSPFGTLMSRPVVPIEQCQTCGTKGDIYFCDWTDYYFCDKGTVDTATSIHIRFDYAETAFRFIYRADGQPSTASAITPYKGSNTVGPFLALAARS